MNIGILGSGGVAKTLAVGFLKHGHAVKLGTRTPAKLADWAAANPQAGVGSVAEAAAFGELLVLAVKGGAAAAALESAGAANLAGKTVLDTTNPIADGPPVHGVLPFFTDLSESLMERLQRDHPNVHFVKAFNSVGSAQMVDPRYKEGKPSMFICGNHDGAKADATRILDQLGWETVDMGHAEAARAIEPLCMLWCILGFTRNEWTHAFKLLRQ